MKIKIIILLGTIMLCLNCGLDTIGKSDCEVHFDKEIKRHKDWYKIQQRWTDAEGNLQSYETCQHMQEATITYLQKLNTLKNELNNAKELKCTTSELYGLVGEIEQKEKELNEDLEFIWNRCEQLYGDN